MALNFSKWHFLILFLSMNLVSLKIKVHVIPHSHDDVGWLHTFDTYYTTVKCVKCILDNMIPTLEKDPKRTFTYVEMAFFKRWYDSLSESYKIKVKNFVKSGQLEFANGGWVMNDEANANYQHIIDQMRLGLDFLKEEFNVTPDTAWSIDPFGHSKTHAMLMAKLGFKNLVFARIDYKEKEIRKAKKEMEFYWYPYWDLDKETNIFTFIAHDHYSVDYKELFRDFLEERKLNLSQNMIQSLANQAVNYFKKLRSEFLTDHVFFFYGDDFTFQRADVSNENLEAIMNFVNENESDIEMIYSTPSRYFKAVKETKLNFPVYKNFDFFPYADDPYVYWTGYFTTRPYLKGMIRDAGDYLVMGSKFVLNYLIQTKDYSKTDEYVSELLHMRQNLAVAQHHDAVTGTATGNVSYDYLVRLRSSIAKVKHVVADILNNEEKSRKVDPNEICLKTNTEQRCTDKVYSVSPESETVIELINPELSGFYPVSLKLNNANVKVFWNNLEQKADIICESQDKTNNQPVCTIYFFFFFTKKILLERLILREYKFDRLKQNHSLLQPLEILPKLILFENTSMRIEFEHENGFLYFDKKKNESIIFKIRHSSFTYTGSQELRKNQRKINRGGAYIMSPEAVLPTPYEVVDFAKSLYFNGENVIFIKLFFDHSNITFKVFKHERFLWMIDIDSESDTVYKNKGEEMFIQIDSGVDNLIKKDDMTEKQPSFFTDTNGLIMIERIKDYRFGWKYEWDEFVSSNFYPVNYAISIREEPSHETFRRLTIYNDRPQAGSSLLKGQILLDFNRATVSVDERGLREAPCEEQSCTKKFKVKHILGVGNMFDNKLVDTLIYSKVMINYFERNRELSYLQEQQSGLSQSHERPFLVNYIDRMIDIPHSTTTCLVEYNIYFKTSKKIVIQFYNKTDPYFSLTEKEECYFYLSSSSDYKVTEVDLSNRFKINSLSDIFLERKLLRYSRQTNTENKTKYRIETQKFKTFLIEIK